MAVTTKQLRFVGALLGPAAGCQAKAAGLAGYKGDSRQLAVIGHQVMRNQEVQRMIVERMEELLERSIGCVSEALAATKQRVLVVYGEIIYLDPVPDHSIRLRAADRVFRHAEHAAARKLDEPEVHPVSKPAEEPTDTHDQVVAIDAVDRALMRQAAEIDEKLAHLDDSSENPG
jgi:Terminase small subunit